MQDVVEVVRDAAGEAPDRLHLLRLPHLRFESRSLRNVARDRRSPYDGTGLILIGEIVERDVDPLTAFANADRLVRLHEFAATDPLEDRRQLVLRRSSGISNEMLRPIISAAV